jgi:hypothetical protein
MFTGNGRVIEQRHSPMLGAFDPYPERNEP